MKKIFFVLSIIFFTAAASHAAFYVDGIGAYVDAGDFKSQLGYGGGFGFGITDNLNFAARVLSSSRTDNVNLPDEKQYELFTVFAGVDFIPVIPFFEKYQLTWNTSILGGMSEASFSYRESTDNDTIDSDDMGVGFAVWTGPHFNMTQYVSLYMEVGYQYSVFQNKFQDESIYGLQAIVGLRISLFGVRDYEDGY